MVDPRIHVLIPAAGAGQRFGGDRPKQYSDFLGGLLIDHTISQIQKLVDSQILILGLARDDVFWRETESSQSEAVKTVVGGDTRAETVFNMLSVLEGVDANDWVLIHDVVRPCIDKASLKFLLKSLSSTRASGLSLGRPVHEAVKRVSAEALVLESENREGLWLTQTPQVFRYPALHKSMQRCMDQSLSFDDEMMALHHCGFPTEMVVGSPLNIKITTQDDLSLAENYWKIMQPNSTRASR